jgi:hypothetical protein
MRWLKKLLQNDYNKGIPETTHKPKQSFKPDIKRDKYIQSGSVDTPLRLDPQTRREGRPRRIYRGRDTPTKIFNFPICSTSNPGQLVPHILFDSLSKGLQKQLILNKIKEEEKE